LSAFYLSYLPEKKKLLYKFELKTINLDFELGMVNLLREELREVEIKGCRLIVGGYFEFSST
jgi:hypothetical protein